jgi:hypothetical protein
VSTLPSLEGLVVLKLFLVIRDLFSGPLDQSEFELFVMFRAEAEAVFMMPAPFRSAAPEGG